jgi:hypothetical protein
MATILLVQVISDTAIGPRVFVHLHAPAAPVGVYVNHHLLAGLLRFGNAIVERHPPEVVLFTRTRFPHVQHGCQEHEKYNT